MTCNYRPYTKEDKLEVGTKIRLAGREGEIINAEYGEMDKVYHTILWDNKETDCLCLRFFTFEIEDTPTPPLKIDKRVKEEIFRIFKFKGFWRQTEESMSEEVMAYLNSLEEV